MARRITVSRRRKRQGLTTIRFRPPNVFTPSSSEILLPVMHTNYSQLRAVRKVFDGSAFYVKAIDKTPQNLTGGYVIMLKLKPEVRGGASQ